VNDAKVENEHSLEGSNTLLNLWRAPTLARPAPHLLRGSSSSSDWNGTEHKQAMARQKKKTKKDPSSQRYYHQEQPLEEGQPLVISKLFVVCNVPPSQYERSILSMSSIYTIYDCARDPTSVSTSTNALGGTIPAKSNSVFKLETHPDRKPATSTATSTATSLASKTTCLSSIAATDVLDPDGRCRRTLPCKVPTDTGPQSLPCQGLCLRCGRSQSAVVARLMASDAYCFRCGSSEQSVRGCHAIGGRHDARMKARRPR